MVHATLVNSKEGGALQVHTTPPTKFGITLYYAKLNSLPIFLAIQYLTCWEATCAVAGRLFSLRSISLSVSLNSPKSSRWSPLVSICSNNLRKWREERRMCVCVWGGGGGFALQAVIELQEKQLIKLHYKIVQLSMSIRL